MFHGINFQSISEATTMYLIVHGILRVAYWALHSTERGAAIFAHYRHQVTGKGHEADSVLDCRQERCAVFAQ